MLAPVDLEASYTPPAVSSGGPTQYTYNRDRQLTAVTRPDGKSISLGYDAAGRLGTLTIARGAYQYGYDTTGRLSTIAAPDGGGLAYSYDGSLLTGADWSGTVAASIRFGYDNDFTLSDESVACPSQWNAACQAVSYSYDNDKLLIGAGALTLTRNPQNGLLTGTSIGAIADSWTYNEFGEPASYAAVINGTTPQLTEQYTRDDAGRIVTRSETIDGTTSVYGYGYDTAGRLTTVTRNGTASASYTYDDNSNRLTKTTATTTEIGTYDAQDRMLTYAGATYAYTANGELQSKTDATGTTTYEYDELGNLTKVTLSDGRVIEYVIDGQNRRIGKKVNGVIVQRLVYSDQLRPAAEVDANGDVVTRFVYGSRSNVPDLIIKGDTTYRVLSDHLGSPRIVLDLNTGAVAERIDYDEFGNVLGDTAPGFLPFGFAGGLYDSDTKLVRFGARDYEARAGRWTSKEPMLFGGGDPNLYAYVFSDPVQLVDPNGQDALCYDGTMLWDFNDAGQTVMVRAATSGRDGVTDPTQRDKGPIPEGTYIINPGEITEVSGVRYLARNARGDWGHFRVPLHPLSGTETFGRDGFFIHGGRLPGSAGCVDVDGAENEIFGRLKKQQGPMALRVGKCR